MISREDFEKVVATCNIKDTLFEAYSKSVSSGNDLINFYETIWAEDVESIADFMVAAGINEFTISSTFSSLLSVLAGLEKRGYKVSGIIDINAPYPDFITGKLAKIPAIRIVKI